MGMSTGMGILAWVFLVLLVLGAAAVVTAVVLGRSRQQPPRVAAGDRAREILDERFARGEIDATEYRDRRRALSGEGS